jgi:hypothetical protein
VSDVTSVVSHCASNPPLSQAEKDGKYSYVSIARRRSNAILVPQRLRSLIVVSLLLPASRVIDLLMCGLSLDHFIFLAKYLCPRRIHFLG